MGECEMRGSMMLFMAAFGVFVAAILWNEYKSADDSVKILARLTILERVISTDNASAKDQLVRLTEHIERLDKANVDHAEWQQLMIGKVKQADDLAHRANVQLAMKKQDAPQPQKILVEFSPQPLRVRSVKPKPQLTPNEAKKLLKKTTKQIRELSN